MENTPYGPGRPNPNWPVHPRWISIREGKKESEVKPNEDGLFTLDTIRGFIAASSDHPDINNTLSLFQVIPADYPFDNPFERIEEVGTKDVYIENILEKRKIIRIDPGRLYDNIGCCDAFRKCEKGRCKDKCFTLDSRIALFYHKDLEDIHYFGRNEDYIRVFRKIVDEYNHTLCPDEKGQQDEPIQIFPYKSYDDKNKCEYTRLYIHYKCKYSGLEEYAFPIFHSGKVIAVLMQGQRPNPDLKNYPMFAPYLNDPVGGENLQSIVSDLRKDENFLLQESLSKERREAIFDRIITFARRINDMVNSISQQYVSNEFQQIENDFRECIGRIQRTDTHIVNEYKKILDQTLKNIFYTFNREGFIRIYSLKDNSLDEASVMAKFELIGDSDPEKNVTEYAHFLFHSLPKEKHTIEKQELLSCLDEEQKPLIGRCHTFRLEIPFVHKMAHIIWKSYTLDDRKYAIQRKYYGDTLKLFYHVLLEPYIILKQIAFEELLEKSIRVSVHETAQVIPPIIQTLKSYFEIEKDKSESITDYYKRFHAEFLNNVQKEGYFKELIKKIGDINNRIELLDGLYKRSTLIFKTVVPTWEWADFFRIIYSIQSLFEEKAFLNNRQRIDIYMDPIFSYCCILTDKNFISQVLFNLVDNAIKYGVRGSKINIRVKMSENSKDYLRHGIIREGKIQIVVENFGDPIEQESKDKIFDLYYRSSKYVNEGLGIGLFLVKRLCKIVGYSVSCQESEEVAQINLPLYYHYTKQNGVNDLDKVLSEKSLPALSINRVVLNDMIERIVNRPKNIDWEVTEEEVEALLYQPFYCNRFIVTIPITNENLKI